VSKISSSPRFLSHVGLGGRLSLVLSEVGEVDERPAQQVLEEDEGLVHVLGDHHEVKLLEEELRCLETLKYLVIGTVDLRNTE